MTQDDLKDYLETEDCYVYKSKVREDGLAYFMRKNGSTKIAVLFTPKEGKYKKENVCHICNILGVPVHIWAKDVQDNLNTVRKNIQNRNKGGDESENQQG